MKISRREFVIVGALGTLPSIISRLFGSKAKGRKDDETRQDPSEETESIATSPSNEQIALLLYPQFTALDVFGPHHMFASIMGAKVHLVSKNMDPIEADTGVQVMPTTTFADCPKDLTVLCVPGGTRGTLAAMKDPETLAFVADRGSRADWVTSVCTGAFVLAAAGLLKGYKATSHWVTRDILADYGATPVNARVVFDRNRVTGGGVTAGLDFGLRIVSRIRGENYAKTVQLFSEYNPDPPYDAGTPESAPPESVALTKNMLGNFTNQLKAIADEANRK